MPIDAMLQAGPINKGNGEAHAWPFLHLTVLNKKKKLVKA